MEDIFKNLSKMSPEEGVAMMKQLFNPLRGRAVGYLGDRGRKQVRQVPEKEQPEMEEKGFRGTPRQMDLFEWREPIYHRVQKKR